jgi:hypothetical protein
LTLRRAEEVRRRRAAAQGRLRRPETAPGQIPEEVRKVRLTEALQRLVRLYEATDNKDEAAKWRKELAAQQESERKPKP